MSPTLKTLGIDQLSIPERIALVQEIWESVASELPRAELTEEQRMELRRRAAEHAANPEDVVPWEQIKAEALARFRR